MNSNDAPERSPKRVGARGRGAVSSPQGRFEQTIRIRPQHPGPGYDPELPVLRTSVRTESARRIVTRNRSPDVFFEQSINPYRGCEHGCIYCYARPNHAYLGLSPGLDFETKLVAKHNALDCLRTELCAPSYRCSPINIGSATDAYQPIEQGTRLTRSIVELLLECRHPLTIITKSAIVERDLDLLGPAGRAGLAAVYVSVTGLDPVLSSSWEPRAATPARRIRLIERLANAGVPVGVLFAPVVPFLNDEDMEGVLAQAAAAGARSAHSTMLRLPNELGEVFADWLHSRFPDRASRVLARIRDLRGGQALNDTRFHDRMTGQGIWSELIRRRFETACRRHALIRSRPDLNCELFVAPDRAGQGQLF